VLVFEQFLGDDAGAARICMLCDQQWTANQSEPRAWIGGEYLGHVCAACVAAGVDQLRQRLQASLAETRERLRQLELVDRWARSASPLERRRSFHVVAVRESEARAGC
jgi:hypothetical protein